MELEARDPQDRRPLGRAVLDPTTRPPRGRVTRPGPNGPVEEDLFLAWEGVLDDSARLRGCPVCGGRSLFRQRSLPALTPFVLVLAFAGVVLAILGNADDPRVFAGLAVLLTLDVGVLFFARTRLVCYRCRSRFGGVPIARQHRPWDAAESARAEHQPGAIAPSPATDTASNPEQAERT